MVARDNPRRRKAPLSTTSYRWAVVAAAIACYMVAVVSSASPTPTHSRSGSGTATDSRSSGSTSPTILGSSSRSLTGSQSITETRSNRSVSQTRTSSVTRTPSFTTSLTSRTRVISFSRSQTLCLSRSATVSRSMSVSRSDTTVTAVLVKTSSVSESTSTTRSATKKSPSRSATPSRSSSISLTSSTSNSDAHTRTVSHVVSTSLSNTRASPTPSITAPTHIRTPSITHSLTLSASATATHSLSTSATLSRSRSSVTMKAPPTATLALSTTASRTTSLSASDRGSSTHDSHSPTTSSSRAGMTASVSPTDAASATGTQSYRLVFDIASVFDDVWATPVRQSDPSTGTRIASSELEVSAALDAGTIPHEALRASAFDLYFHVRAEEAHRFFAAAPPIPIVIKGPSFTSYVRMPEQALVVVTVSAVDFNRFEYRRFSIQIGPASWARVVEPCWFNLTVVPHAAIPIEIETRLSDAASATAVIFFSPVSSVLQSRALIMTSLVVCQADSVHVPFSILGVGVGEQGGSGYYYRGAIAGNLGLMAIAMCVPLTIAVVATAAARPKRRRTTWQRCCEVLHLPSSVVISGQLVLQPTVASSAALLYNWGTHADISAACVGITIALMYATFVTYFSLVRLPMSLESRRTPPDAHSTRNSTRLPKTVHTYYQTMVDVCRGTTHWSATLQRHKTWKRQHYFLFALHDRRLVLAAEMWIQLIVAALAGVRPGITEYCAFHHILLAVVFTGLLVFHMVYRPLLSLMHHVVTVACYGMWTCAAVYAVVGLLLGYGGESTTLLDATIVINVMTTCLAIVCALPNGVYLMLHLKSTLAALWHASEFRPVKDPPKPKPRSFVAVPAPPSPWVRSAPPPATANALPPPPLGLPPPPKRRQTFRELTVLRQRDIDFGIDVVSDSSSSSSVRSSSLRSSNSSVDDTESMRSMSPVPMNPLPQSLHQQGMHDTGLPSAVDAPGSVRHGDPTYPPRKEGSSTRLQSGSQPRSSGQWDSDGRGESRRPNSASLRATEFNVRPGGDAWFSVPIKEVDESML